MISVSRPRQWSLRQAQAGVVGMALGLMLFGWGGALPFALVGLLIFGGLALLQPQLALLFVLLTAPLYLIPASVSGLRARSFDLPVHEAALLALCVALAARGLWQLAARRADLRALIPASIGGALWRYAPQLLFLLAGLGGVALAIARGPALIELRRLIIEPLIFYGCVSYWLAREAQPGSIGQAGVPFRALLLRTLVAGGALVGLLGLLQYLGLDLVPYLGKKQCFAPDGSVCANIVADGGVRRVLSVYGHPNNLGLFLGRVWPIAAALTWYAFGARRSGALSAARERPPRLAAWPWLLGTALCVGGLLVSFSRGAWLGALAALAVLVLGSMQVYLPRVGTARGRGSLPWLIGFAVALVVLAGLALSLRGDVTAGSTPVRLLLWREALGYIRLHPLGIGLDQFVYYHDPSSGRSLIDPALVGTSEQYAAHPHNLLLDIWLRLGPLGLIAFGWLLWRFFQAARRRLGDPVALGVLAAMTAALAHGLVDNFYFVPDLALLFWLLLALAEHAPERAVGSSVT